MLALLLIGALVAQALGVPTDCTELCDDVNGGYSSGQAHSSYRSYSKSGGSYGSSQRLQRLGSSARLENLDENVISPSAERPGSWQNEKHYVTDDGHGQMHYREGQTVSDNGYSKFAEHSYSYGSHDSHAPRANSQILSTAEFNSEIQNMRNRIASFMGKYNVNAGSIVSANIIADFKDRAETISGQLANVCNQVDIGSAMYQQMQEMQRQFQQDVERLQRQMEQQLVIQTSSSSSSSSSSHIVHGSMHYPSSSIQPSYVPAATAAPAAIHEFTPSSQVTEENIVQQQHLEQEISQVSTQIYTFYNSFTNVEASSDYKKNFNDQVNAIHQKLIDLKLQAIQYKSLRQRIENDMAHFETYVGQLRARIQQEEEREFEERRRKLEAEEQAQKERFESYQREIEAKKLQVQQEAENLRKQHEAQLRREQEAAELLKIQEAAEKLRLEQLETRRRQAEITHKAEQLRLQQQQEEQRLQEQLHQQQQQLAIQRQLKAKKQQQQEEAARLETVQHPQPSVSSHQVKVSGSSSYESVVNTFGGQQGTTSSSAASFVRPTMNAHVDLTAVTSRLQRELNRLQNEINNFNTYAMRLTAANSQSVISEAERQAELLRQNINNLCETSGRYHNENVQTSAEELSRRFEEMVRQLQSQAANYTAQGGAGFSASAGYSTHSSYGSSGVVSSVRQPSITNVEYEHSKSAEVEISRRPISSSQRYVNGQVDCVEVYAGQPCVQQNYRRYRRQVGDDKWSQQQQQQQQHQPIFPDDNNNYQRSRNEQPTAYTAQPDDSQMTVGPKFGVLSYGPKSGNPETERRIEDFTRRIGSYGLSNDRNDASNQQSHDYSRQQQLENPNDDGLEILRAEDLKEHQIIQPHITEESTIDFEHSSQPVIPYSGQQSTLAYDDDLGRNEESQPAIKNDGTSSLSATTRLRNEDDKPVDYEKSLTNGQRSNAGSDKGLTLQASGFYEETENPENTNGAQTLEESGFYDKPRYNVGSAGQYDENLQLLGENSERGRDYSQRNGETVDNSRQRAGDSSNQQRVVEQPNYDNESQLGRQYTTSRDSFTPSLKNVPDKRKFDDEQVTEQHPKGRYVINTSVQQRVVPETITTIDIKEIIGDSPSEQIESANDNKESTEREETTTTARPTLKPTPKPVPRYTRPWQVNQSNNENESKPIEHDNVTKPGGGPHRGDLPGRSESFPESTNPPLVEPRPPVIVVTTQRPTTTVRPFVPVVTQQPIIVDRPVTEEINNNWQPNIKFNFKQHQEHSVVRVKGNTQLTGGQNSNNKWQTAVNVQEKVQLPDVHKFNNEWQESPTGGLDKFGQTNQGFYNQNYNHNFKYSQHSNVYNQNSNKYQFDQHNQFGQQVRPTEFNYQVKPAEYFGNQQGSTYRMKTNLELQQEALKANPFEQTTHFQFGGQSNFGHQIRPTEFGSHLTQPTEFGHHQESYKYREHQKSNIRLQQQGTLQPSLFQPTFQFDSQGSFGQQIQAPTFFQSGQLQSSTLPSLFSLENSSQNSKFTNLDNLTPLNLGLPPIQPWSGIEPSSTQNSYYKRVGHKLSYSYDKANEGARTIYG